MNTLSQPYPVRLNPDDEVRLNTIIRQLTTEDLSTLIELDRQRRNCRRAGPPPTPRALILRRAIEIGLHSLDLS